MFGILLITNLGITNSEGWFSSFRRRIPLELVRGLCVFWLVLLGCYLALGVLVPINIL